MEIVIIAVAPDALAVTEVGLMEQVICALAEDGWQVRSTVPLKPAIDVTVICDVACWPGAEAVADKPNTEKSGVGVSPAQAVARLVTSTEPSPVTRSYPAPALKPY